MHKAERCEAPALFTDFRNFAAPFEGPSTLVLVGLEEKIARADIEVHDA